MKVYNAITKEITEVEENISLPQPDNNEIRLLRKQAYKEESDDLYMAYIKYKEQGRLIKAEQTKILWLEKVSEVDERYPYNVQDEPIFNIDDIEEY